METKRYGVAVTSGLVTIWTLFLFFSFFFSAIIQFTNMTEETFSLTFLLTAILIMFIGGIVTGFKSKRRGIFMGLLTGITFIIILFLIQFLGLNAGWHTSQLLFYVGFLIACVVGSIIGVNLSGKN